MRWLGPLQNAVCSGVRQVPAPVTAPVVRLLPILVITILTALPLLLPPFVPVQLVPLRLVALNSVLLEPPVVPLLSVSRAVNASISVPPSTVAPVRKVDVLSLLDKLDATV